MNTLNLPLGAQVQCTDGEGGSSIAIVVHPFTRSVTHLVVQNKALPEGRLVPLSLVTGTSAGLIRLACTTAELAVLPPFTETRYVKSAEPIYLPQEAGYTGAAIMGQPAYMAPVVIPAGTELPEDVELLPAGEKAIHHGMRVEAADGHIGEVGELLIDPSDGKITHFVLRQGHAWGKTDVTLPLSAIERVGADTVYLKLNKQGIELLPGIPVKRPDKHATYGRDVELLAYVFDDPLKADEALDQIKQLQRSKSLKILSAAVVVKEQDGKTSVKEVGDMSAGGGAKRGALIGGALAVLGPVGIIAGVVGGAVVGGVAAKVSDSGFKNKFLALAQERIKPGTSGLLVVVEHDWVNSLADVLSGLPGVMVQTTLTDKIVDELLSGGQEKTSGQSPSQS